MKLTNLSIGILIMGACILALYGTLEYMARAENYNVDVDLGYKETYNKVSNVTENFQNASTRLTNIKLDKATSYLTLPVDLFRITVDTVQGIKGTILIGFNLINDMTKSLHFPDWANGFLIGCLAVLVVGFLLYLFIGRET